MIDVKLEPGLVPGSSRAWTNESHLDLVACVSCHDAYTHTPIHPLGCRGFSSTSYSRLLSFIADEATLLEKAIGIVRYDLIAALPMTLSILNNDLLRFGGAADGIKPTIMLVLCG